MTTFKTVNWAIPGLAAPPAIKRNSDGYLSPYLTLNHYFINCKIESGD